MNANSLLDAFGGSIFPDEYRGNLEGFGHDQEPSQHGDPGDDQRLASTLLSAVRRMLQGNLGAARTLIDQLTDLSPRWTLRREIYLSYLEYLRRFPPIIMFRPEHGGPAAMFRNADLKYRDTVDRLGTVELRQEHFQSLQDFMEFHLVHTLLGLPLCLWTASYPQHPEYPRGGWNDKTGPLDEGLNRIIARLKALRDLMDGNDVPRLGDYAQLLITTLYAGKGRDLHHTAMAELSERYRLRGDAHGQALVLMLRADSLLSPPFSSPIALNLVPIDSDDAGSSNLVWDPIEDNLKLQPSETASELYLSALDLADMSTSPRLRAAILLRQGCLRHLQGIGKGCQDPSGLSHLKAAEEKFSEVTELCAGDEVLEQMICCHRILLNLGLGRYENTIQEAHTIGHWGRLMKNEGLSQFLGLLMLRFGRQQWVRYQRIDIARRAFACAVRCFEGLEDHFARFQAMTFELDLYQSISDFTAARSLLNEQLPLFRRAISEMETRASESLAKADDILLLRKNVLVTFGAIVSNILCHSDIGKLPAWRDELDRYNAHQGTKDAVNRALQTPSVVKRLLSGTVFEENPDTLFQTADDDQVAFDRYYIAQNEYKLHLQNIDREAAERTLHAYIQYTKLQSGSSYVRYLTMIYAHFQLGETEEARQLLAYISDAEIFNGKVEYVPNSASPWAKSRHSTRLVSPEGADNAVAICALAHEWGRGMDLLTKIQSLSSGYLDPNGPDLVPEVWQRFCWAGIINEHSCRWKEAYHLYTEAVDLLEVRRGHSSDADTRRSMFSTLAVGEVFAGLARICLRCHGGDVPLSLLDNCGIASSASSRSGVTSWQDQALHFLEQGTARSISDDLLKKIPHGDELYPKLETLRKKRLKRALNALPESARTADEVAELEGLTSELSMEDNFLDDMIPDFASISLQELYRAIPEDAYVVLARFSRYGSIRMGIRREGIAYGEVFETRDVDVRVAAFDVLHHLHAYAADHKLARSEYQDQLWGALSRVLLAPLSAMPPGKDHIIFAISQPLNSFPFAALPYNGPSPLFLSKSVSVIPSLAALAHLNTALFSRMPTTQSPTSTAPLSVSIISKSMTRADLAKHGRSFAHGGVAGEAMLPMAPIEGMAIARLFRNGGSSNSSTCWPLRAKVVGRAKFRAILARSDVLVLGTHGFFDARGALFSHVSLKERFRVIDLVAQGDASRMPLLVVFAACLSGMGSTAGAAGGDVLGFSHAMLAAGVQSFLGCLWRVDDTAALLLLVLFFRELAAAAKVQGDGGVAGRSLAELWRRAQVGFYSLGVDGARAMIDDIADEIARAEAEGRDPSQLVHDYRFLLKIRKEGLDIDFTNPFYYAAFALFGHGAQCVG